MVAYPSMKYRLVFLDTETTGNEADDRLCQLCYIYTDGENRIVHNCLYTPPKPISIGAMAVHHITNRHIEGKPLFVECDEYTQIRDLLQDPLTVVIAHNAPFDIGMLSRENITPINYIDTLKVVRNLNNAGEFTRHNLQYLRYHLDLDQHISESIQAHDALGDVIVLEHLFTYLMQQVCEQEGLSPDEYAIERMIEISTQPSFIPKVTFGKYAEKTVWDIAKIDRGYLEWLLREKKKDSGNGKDESDWIFTLETVLKEV